jgi:hypothetical protein
VFLAAGGFARRYPRPSIEDIDLGVRLHRAGKRIRLVKDLQVTHMKEWSLRSLIRSDVCDRAIPWTELILRSGGAPDDLNLRRVERVAAVLALVAIAGFASGAASFPPLAALPAVVYGGIHLADRGSRRARLALAAVIVPAVLALAGAALVRFGGASILVLAPLALLAALRRDVYRFFARVEGPGFLLLVLPLQALYYGYSILGAAIGFLRFAATGRGEAARSAFRVMLALLFGLALTSRIAFLEHGAEGPLGNSDSPGYELLARNLAQGSFTGPEADGYPGRPPLDLLRPPGYPLLLHAAARLGLDTRLAIGALQSALGALACVVLAAVVARRFGRTAGLAAGALWASDWVTLVHTPLSIAETAFSIGVAAGVLTLAGARRRPRLVLGGAIVGAAALVKPIGLVVLPAIAVAAWFATPARRWTSALSALAGAGLLILPWAARNLDRHGVFTISAIVSVNWGLVSSHGMPREERLPLIRSLIATEGDAAERLRAVDARSSGIGLANVSGILSMVPESTARTLFGTAAKTLEVSRGREIRPRDSMIYEERHLLPLAQIAVFWAAVAAGVIALRRRRADLALFVGVPACLLGAALTVGYGRFRVPAVPLLSVAGGVGVARAFGRRSLDSGPAGQLRSLPEKPKETTSDG